MMADLMKRSFLAVPIVGAVLLVSGCVTRTEFDTLESQYSSLQQAHQQLNAQNTADEREIAALKQRVSANEEHISRLQNAIKYTVNSDLLFPTGSWRMSEAGKKIIAKFAPQLAPYQEQKIVVNGYTDDRPIGAELRKQGIASNEVLSQKRAEAVMQYLVSLGVKPDMVSAHGYGEADPIAPNDTPAHRAENRRVEIALAQ